MIGRVIDDRYEIVGLIGQGGMGAVYEARHTGTGRRVAIKVILGDQFAGDDLARFQREARAVGAVESQHIAQVFDTGRDRGNGVPFIAMELLDGEDVRSLVKRIGPLPIDLSLRLALQACVGLERAHRAKIIHRDIKSANLFLARQEGGRRIVKLLDFGVAKMADPDLVSSGLTQTGALLGSPLYMSPEQARGSGVVDHRSDLWSLGITLYECLTGHPPNGGIQGLGELIAAILTIPARWIQDVAPWVPPEVAQVVHRALAIDPNARYASASDFAAALSSLLPQGCDIEEGMLVPLSAGTRAVVAPRVASSEQSAAGAISFGVTNKAAPRASGGVRLALLMGGTLILAAAGSLGVYLTTRAGSAPEITPAAPAEPHASPEEPALPSSSSVPTASASVERGPEFNDGGVVAPSSSSSTRLSAGVVQSAVKAQGPSGTQGNRPVPRLPATVSKPAPLGSGREAAVLTPSGKDDDETSRK